MSSLPEQIESDKPVARMRKILSWTVMRLVVAVIILTAAGMKAHQLATTPSLGEGLLNARWFNILVVEFELFFGIWLIFGLLPKLTWLATVGCFTVFAAVSFYKAISGEASCGCFGATTINPWITMVFDSLVVGILLFCRPHGIFSSRKGTISELLTIPQPRRIILMALIWLVFAVPTTMAMMSVEKNDMAELGTEFIGADGRKTVTLEPEKWMGKDFTLTVHTNLHSKLTQGVWLVLLHTHTCSSCRESVRLYRELAMEFAQNEKAPRIAMLELPPYDTEHSEFWLFN